MNFPTATLRHGMLKLPQELYDYIWDLFFSIQPDVRTITNSTHPPVQLQINRASRLHYSKTYFSSPSIFIFHPHGENTTREVTKWLSSLDVEHERLVEHIRLVANTEYRLCVRDAFMRNIQNQQVCLRIDKELEEEGGNFGLPHDNARYQKLFKKIRVVDEDEAELLRKCGIKAERGVL